MNFIFLVSNFSINRKRVVDDSSTIIYIVRERRKRFCHTLYRNIFQLSSHWVVFCCESWESSTVSTAFGQGPLMERRNYRAFGILTNAWACKIMHVCEYFINLIYIYICITWRIDCVATGNIFDVNASDHYEIHQGWTILFLSFKNHHYKIDL